MKLSQIEMLAHIAKEESDLIWALKMIPESNRTNSSIEKLKSERETLNRKKYRLISSIESKLFDRGILEEFMYEE